MMRITTTTPHRYMNLLADYTLKVLLHIAISQHKYILELYDVHIEFVIDCARLLYHFKRSKLVVLVFGIMRNS